MDLPIFVINLDRNPDRLAFIRRQLETFGLSFERLSAVDGATLTTSQVGLLSGGGRRWNGDYFRPLTSGEVGCYASHRACWQRIVDRRLPAALVLEDDVELSATFAGLLPAVSRLSDRFEYILLSNHRRGFIRLETIDGAHAVVAFSRPPARSVAQVISASGARKLLERVPPYLRPIDIDLQFPWEIGELEIVSVWPPPARHPDQGFRSEIRSRTKLPVPVGLAKIRFDSLLMLKSWVRLWRRFGLLPSLTVALGREYGLE
jgi:glycosyl transferase family 25